MLCGIYSLPTRRESLELAALAFGIKKVVRITIYKERTAQLKRRCTKSGFEVLIPELFIRKFRQDADKNEFFSLVDKCDDPWCLQVAYVYRRANKATASKLYELECGEGTSEEIGRILGYPTCCCRNYSKIEAGEDWLERMLKNTPARSTPFAACNRCARLFGDWGVLPDFFPCSFSCCYCARWAEQIDKAGRQCGLGGYLDNAWRELRRPIDITKTKVSRLIGEQRQTIRRGTSCKERTLIWT